MSSIARIQEALAELAHELAHAEHLIEEQAARIEVLEAEVALLRFGSAAALLPKGMAAGCRQRYSPCTPVNNRGGDACLDGPRAGRRPEASA